MKKYWFTLLAGILLTGTYLVVPPYTFQAIYYFLTNTEELNKIDSDFANSNKEKWVAENCNLAPIFKTKQGSRLYYIGSLNRFGRRFDIAFINGGKENDLCSPFSIYSSQRVKCDIPLSAGWVINYEIMDEIAIDISSIN
ncbi:MAG: hypothetical protein COA86_18900 [Kangiella sp.]|nr:MAG: hypothetical protein COA86_18900 [Kangiella sp.]